MANITYADRSQIRPYDATKFNAQDANEIKTAVNSKQDAETGKGLSTNDYTNTEKTKLSGIATGATANSTDSALRDRSTHTGVQAATTITEDATHRFATDSEKTTWNAKQAALVSGTNIKTINSTSLLGSGNLDIETAMSSTYFEGETDPTGSGDPIGSDTNPVVIKASVLGGGGVIDSTPTNGSTNAVSSDGVFDALAAKQAALVSGTNIKTINGSSILGSGDLVVSGGSGSGDILTTITANNTADSYEIDISSYTSYKMIEIRFDNWNMGSTGRDLMIDIKMNGSYQAGTNTYKYTYETGGGQGLNTLTNKIAVGDFMKYMDGFIYISYPALTTRTPIIRIKGSGKDGSDGIFQMKSSTMPVTTGYAITHIKIYTSGTGFGVNIEAGTFTVIGHL